jgi:hypothetical protein
MAQNMSGGMTASNAGAANAAVGNYFMVGDVLMTMPMDPATEGSGTGADQKRKNYGMTIAAMSQHPKTIGMTVSSSGMASATSTFVGSAMHKSGVRMSDMRTLVNKLSTSTG